MTASWTVLFSLVSKYVSKCANHIHKVNMLMHYYHHHFSSEFVNYHQGQGRLTGRITFVTLSMNVVRYMLNRCFLGINTSLIRQPLKAWCIL